MKNPNWIETYGGGYKRLKELKKNKERNKDFLFDILMANPPFAVSEKAGKDNSGDYIYVKNGEGKPKLDKYGHLIVDHDLHNHNGELSDGIVEAFIDWAKKEKLSFWRHER